MKSACAEVDRLEGAAQEQGRAEAFSEAFVRVQEHYDGLAMTEDSYEAARWFLNQLERKSLDEFLAEHPPESETEPSSTRQ
ncbi:MAG: hypothetical protein KY475_17960 [Planctomycetes bacterium]|nr:hypothetical protein [Planctomycetota bacterium]